MAGIAGIILKYSDKNELLYKTDFDKMMNKLSISDIQLRKIYFNEKCVFGNVVPVTSKINNHYQYNGNLKIHCIVDGLVFISDTEKNIIHEEYNLNSSYNDYQFLPYLSDYYKSDIVNHITGWYNIFIYNENDNYMLLFNDRFGFLPLYYYETGKYFLFSSKIESILASGLMKNIDFDYTTITEHLFFNYPLSDYTYIKDINTLPNATVLKYDNNGKSKNKYWNIGELYGLKPLNETESIALIYDEIRKSVKKIINSTVNKINFSLTGGWDSRVVLAYLLPEYRERINAYSFGAKDSYDINIPAQISKKEILNYTPFILDDKYLDNHFLSYAVKTIELSGGTRNYKRAHYLYAIEGISGISNLLITGIFGDEVLKVTKPQGGLVFSKNLVQLIENDFNIKKIAYKISQYKYLKGFQINDDNIIEQICSRLNELKEYLSRFDSLYQKYYSLRFEINLRKYFGNEANSYNDFVYCSSPFMDYDFIKNFALTNYFGTNYNFDTTSIKLKKQSTLLYYKLIKKNCPSLIYYNTSRGYSIRDAVSIVGNTKILYHKYLKKKNRSEDAFNTNPADKLFDNYIINKFPVIKNNNDNIKNKIRNFENNADSKSLLYWINTIRGKYLI
jgi:asparagine synthetase B (glutamine-hydrolysing)